MVSFNKKRINRISKNGDKVALSTVNSSGNINYIEVEGDSVSNVNAFAVADDAVQLYDGSILKRIKYNLIIEKGRN